MTPNFTLVDVWCANEIMFTYISMCGCISHLSNSSHSCLHCIPRCSCTQSSQQHCHRCVHSLHYPQSIHPGLHGEDKCCPCFNFSMHVPLQSIWMSCAWPHEVSPTAAMPLSQDCRETSDSEQYSWSKNTGPEPRPMESLATMVAPDSNRQTYIMPWGKQSLLVYQFLRSQLADHMPLLHQEYQMKCCRLSPKLCWSKSPVFHLSYHYQSHPFHLAVSGLHQHKAALLCRLLTLWKQNRRMARYRGFMHCYDATNLDKPLQHRLRAHKMSPVTCWTHIPQVMLQIHYS